MQPPDRTVSIVVVAFNEAAHLPRLAESLRALLRPPSVEIETVLVDGGSGDGTAKAADRLGFDRILVRPGASIPVCRNAGARAARGDWLAYLDADCTVAPDWAEAAVARLRDGADLAGWPAVPPPGGTWVQRAWAVHWQHKHRQCGTPPRPVESGAFRLLTARNLVLTRRAFTSLAGFDERLATGEDTDFAFRAEQAGLRVVADPALRAFHHREPDTAASFFRQQCWHANRTAYPAIVRGGYRGGGWHAPVFGLLFAGASAAGLAGVAGVLSGRPAGWWGVVPLAVLVVGPAAVIAGRARRARWIPALSALYALYGAARALDLVGLCRRKTPWRRPVPPAASSR